MLVLILLVLLILLFSLSGIFLGAPFLPTLKDQIEVSLELADLKKGQTILELGCGDGRVLVAAAERGLKAVGYELNPVLVVIAWFRTRHYPDVKVVWGDYWRKDWPVAEAVFVFLINRYMPKLDRYLNGYSHKPLKLVSFAFKVPGKKITAQKNGVFLYTYS